MTLRKAFDPEYLVKLDMSIFPHISAVIVIMEHGVSIREEYPAETAENILIRGMGKKKKICEVSTRDFYRTVPLCSASRRGKIYTEEDQRAVWKVVSSG